MKPNALVFRHDVGGRSTQRWLWVAAVTVLAMAPSIHGAEQQAPPGARLLRNVLCGPKCVRYVLEEFGLPKPNEVMALAREMNWLDIEKGTSLQDLERSLNQRGLHTKALQIANHAAIDWPYPVIVHWKAPTDEHGNAYGAGHFVVWRPSSTTQTIEFYDGMSMVRTLPHSAWHARRSGTILLTSPTPIEQPERAVRYSGLGSDGIYSRLVGGMVLAMGLISLVTSVLLNKINHAKESVR